MKYKNRIFHGLFVSVRCLPQTWIMKAAQK